MGDGRKWNGKVGETKIKFPYAREFEFHLISGEEPLKALNWNVT